MGNKASKSKNSDDRQPCVASEFDAQRKKYKKAEVAYHELIVFGYLRQCAGRRDMSIHYDLMRHCTTWYRPIFEFTKWSSRHGMIEGFRHENQQHLIVRRHEYHYRNDNNYRYILAHFSNLVKSGAHCWRIFVKIDKQRYIDQHRNGRVIFAISTTERRFVERDMTWINQGDIFGVSDHHLPTSRFKGDINAFNINGNYAKGIYEYQVDLLLDCDNRILRLCVVDSLNDEQEYVLWDLPKNKGWIPHIQTSCQGLQLKIAKISIEWYGITFIDKYQQISSKFAAEESKPKSSASKNDTSKLESATNTNTNTNKEIIHTVTYVSDKKRRKSF